MLKAILACNRWGAIGHQGSLPWHYPEDMAHFKRETRGQAVIMGRKTWDSLPARFRPLPGRRNLVATLDDSRAAEISAAGAERLSCVDLAAGLDAWVIGGAEIYRLLWPHVSMAVVTIVPDEVPDADAFVDPDLWTGPGWKMEREEQAGELVFQWHRRLA